MKEGKVVVGIDIGTSKIVTVIAKLDEENTINIVGVSEVKSGGIKKGQIVDIEDAVFAINGSLEAAERMAGYSASHVVVSVGGGHIQSQNSKGVVAVATPEGEITHSDMVRVIDAARAISLPSSREILHVLPRSYTVDGQEDIKDPIGMTGVRLEVETHIISAGTTTVRNLQKALSQVGVDVDAFVFTGYASSLAVLSETEKELGVVLVDIGSGTTDISVYVDGSIAYSSVLPIGARNITNDLAIGLRISLESAEKIKLFLSKAQKKITRYDYGEENRERKNPDEIDLSELKLPEELRMVSQKTLVEGIIRPRLNEIFTLIGVELKKSGWGGQTPAGVVVTGGGARTVGISDSAKRMLAMPVRIGFPSDLKGIVDEVQDTPFAAVIGLINYGSHLQISTSSGLGMFKMRHVPAGKIGKKIFNLIKSFIP